jgi:hypothetical protein
MKLHHEQAIGNLQLGYTYCDFQGFPPSDRKGYCKLTSFPHAPTQSSAVPSGAGSVSLRARTVPSVSR